jgi:ATP-dependent Clp endopeptidase proteolytic subunit ClpP
MRFSANLLLILLIALSGLCFGWIAAIAAVSVKHNKPSTEKQVETAVLPSSTPVSLKFQATKKVNNIKVTMDQIVVLNGEVNQDSLIVADQIMKKSDNIEGLPTYLLINSPGGSVMSGAFIISAMEASKVPVNTVCLQYCASMAAFIHQYGKERLMVDRSFLMFHDAAGGLEGYVPHMEAQLSMLVRYITRFDAYVANRTGIPLDDFLNIQHKNLWIDGEDAVSKKFADQLAFIQVTNNFGKPEDLTSFIKIPKTKDNKKPNYNNPSIFDITL